MMFSNVQLAQVTCFGDSMLPTLPNGSQVLFNITIKHPVENKLIAVVQDNQFMVRRYKGGLLCADNPEFDNIPLKPEANVIGVFFGQIFN